MIFSGQEAVGDITPKIPDHITPPEVGNHGHMLGGLKALVPSWQGGVDRANLQV